MQIKMLFHSTIEKKVKRFLPDHPLYHRREMDYPAYPEFPRRIILELNLLAITMMEAIPRVQVPTLLIHSRDDHSVPFACMQLIYDHIGSPCKEMLPLDGMDHSLVCDPKRQVVFDAVEKFLSKARG